MADEEAAEAMVEATVEEASGLVFRVALAWDAQAPKEVQERQLETIFSNMMLDCGVNSSEVGREPTVFRLCLERHPWGTSWVALLQYHLQELSLLRRFAPDHCLWHSLPLLSIHG